MEGHTTIQLRIKTLTKEVIRVSIGLTDNVIKLKELIYATKQEYPISKQKLVHRGKYMLDADIMSGFTFRTNDVIVMMIDRSSADEPRQPDVNTAAAATNQTSSAGAASKDSEVVDVPGTVSAPSGAEIANTRDDPLGLPGNLNDLVDCAISSFIESLHDNVHLHTLKGRVHNNPAIITKIVKRLGLFTNCTMDVQRQSQAARYMMMVLDTVGKNRGDGSSSGGQSIPEDIVDDPDYHAGQDISMADAASPEDDEEDDTMSWEEAGYMDARDSLLAEVGELEEEEGAEEEEDGEGEDGAEEEEDGEGSEYMDEIDDDELDQLNKEAEYHQSTLPGDTDVGGFILKRSDKDAIDRLTAKGYDRDDCMNVYIMCERDEELSLCMLRDEENEDLEEAAREEADKENDAREEDDQEKAIKAKENRMKAAE